MTARSVYKIARQDWSRRRHARGSVLIVAVVLVVILALLGTAYLSTTRVDRKSSELHKANTQIDFIVDGVKQMMLARVANMPADYRNGTWLAARMPEINCWWTGDSRVIQTINWPSISMPLTSSVFRGSAFVSPFGYGSMTIPFSNFGDQLPKDTYQFMPTQMRINGVDYPAFRLCTFYGESVNPDFTIHPPNWMTFMAADADGDGIADSGYFQLPGTSIDGVTYYAAVRIIDNNSAINVNTAWQQQDFRGDGTTMLPNQGQYLGCVGLNELLKTYTPSNSPTVCNQGAEARALNAYRWGGAYQSGILYGGGTPALDNGMLPMDFRFASQQDAQNAQLARRVDNPGQNGDQHVSYQAFGLGDQFSLSYPFAIRPSSVGMSSLEKVLMQSLYGPAPGCQSVRSTPYAPGDIWTGIATTSPGASWLRFQHAQDLGFAACSSHAIL